jgi:hypothetical protein
MQAYLEKRERQLKMFDKSIDERLHKLAEEFRKLNQRSTAEKTETSPEELALNFGLSLSQAKAWLRQELNYPADEKKQRFRTDEDETTKQCVALLFNKRACGRRFCCGRGC